MTGRSPWAGVGSVAGTAGSRAGLALLARRLGAGAARTSPARAAGNSGGWIGPAGMGGADSQARHRAIAPALSSSLAHGT